MSGGVFLDGALNRVFGTALTGLSWATPLTSYAIVCRVNMRHHPSGARGVCSFCTKSLRKDRIEVMGFRLHLVCADNVATVLGKVKAFNQWKMAHPQSRSFELTA
jgi:hypothetical protein